MKLVVADAATADMAEASEWYEGRQHGLGAVFLAAVDAMFAHIREHPMRYRIAHGTLRRAMVPRFPFCVFYRVEKEQIVVLGIIHGRRHPRRWMKRET